MIRLLLALLLASPAWAQRSGYDDASPETRAMQDDDSANPGFLWVRQGEELWSSSCASCHGVPASMRGVAARYPAWDQTLGRPITLAQRIAQHQGVSLPDDAVLALSALVGLQSRGMKLTVATDGKMAPFVAEGARLFHLRQGQLNLSCANCHDDHAGQRLGGSIIPEGHANGYPQYRLEWQGLGSFSRRLRSCMLGVRAEPYLPGSEQAVAIELYLAQRAAGLKVETPSVRP
jgi:sulfur-oxidizing protein SoxA